MKLQTVLDDFLLEQQFRGNSQKTIIYYDNSIHRFLDYMGENADLDNIDLPLLRKYYSHLKDKGLCSTTIQTYIRALRAFLTWCFSEEYIHDDLSSRFRLPKAQRKTIDILTDEEIKRLFAAFNPRYLIHLRNYCLCALMLDSGLRMQEAALLTLDQIKLQNGYVIVDGKGNKQRIVPLGLSTRKMLSRYITRRPPVADTDQVFLMSDLRPITLDTVRQMFRKLKKKTGISRVRAHLLLHTFATVYLENGGDPYTLQQILGHTTMEMVKRYVHTTRRKMVPSFTNHCPLDNLPH